MKIFLKETLLAMAFIGFLLWSLATSLTSKISLTLYFGVGFFLFISGLLLVVLNYAEWRQIRTEKKDKNSSVKVFKDGNYD
ncbi:MAG: hypothetical protein ACW97P_03555 [Candidatus Hodarchaeales archaeon]|jgi:hypothetical protein